MEADVQEPGPPSFTTEEIAADALALADRKGMFYTAVLFRAYYPKVFHEWLRLSLKVQRGRHGTTTYAETMAAISLVGLKPADQGDEWGQCLDELLKEIGESPSVAFARDWVDPDDRGELQLAKSADTGPAEGGVPARKCVEPTDERLSYFHELTLDDLAGEDPFRF